MLDTALVDGAAVGLNEDINLKKNRLDGCLAHLDALASDADARARDERTAAARAGKDKST